MTDEDIVFPTKRGRVVFTTVLVLGAAFLLGFEPAVNWYLAHFGLQRDLGAINTAAIASWLASLSLNVGVSYIALRLGARAYQEKRWPPKGYPVIFRTKVQRGRRALMQVVAANVVAVLFGAIACLDAYGLWLSIMR